MRTKPLLSDFRHRLHHCHAISTKYYTINIILWFVFEYRRMHTIFLPAPSSFGFVFQFLPRHQNHSSTSVPYHPNERRRTRKKIIIWNYIMWGWIWILCIIQAPKSINMKSISTIEFRSTTSSLAPHLNIRLNE